MKKRYSEHDKPMDDAVLHRFLKCHDPVTPPSQASLAALEMDILTKIDLHTRNHVRQVPIDRQMPLWMIPQGWTARTVAVASVLIIASGFIFGQISFDQPETSASIEAPSLFALADEPILQSIPATDASWRENNDDAQ